MIMCYDRDHRGRLPLFDASAGRYRWLTEAEHAAIDAAEAREAEEMTVRIAKHQEMMADPAYAEAYTASLVPNPNNCNRVSYGRGQIISRPDGTEYTVNWPERDDRA
jgi:hypothetical protein